MYGRIILPCHMVTHGNKGGRRPDRKVVRSLECCLEMSHKGNFYRKLAHEKVDCSLPDAEFHQEASMLAIWGAVARTQTSAGSACREWVLSFHFTFHYPYIIPVPYITLLLLWSLGGG